MSDRFFGTSMFTRTYWSPRPRPVDVLDALAAHTERRAGLRAFRNLVLDAAVDGRHLQRIAECSLRERNRNIDMYIRAVASKDRVRTDGNRYEQIACRAAIYAGIALTALLDGLTIVDTGRNVDFELAGLADTTLTAALRTRLLDDLAGAAAVRASALRLEHAERRALGLRNTPVPRQFGQVSAVVPFAAPVPPQSSQDSMRSTVISFSQPNAASSNDRITV